jgi:glyoxylase-like metal-dependent hydrolase (beta-lactamase superfamily II)
VELECVFAPGHSDDHIAVYFPAEKAYFSGDNILGGSSTSVLDLASYIGSMNSALQRPIEIIYPAHGTVYYGAELCHKTILGIIEHRTFRENQIVTKLQSTLSSSFDDLFFTVYPNLTDTRLIESAKWNLTSHLTKLINENRVHRSIDDTYTL